MPNSGVRRENCCVDPDEKFMQKSIIFEEINEGRISENILQWKLQLQESSKGFMNSGSKS